MMIKVRGIYNGENIILLEPLALPANTEVEILVPELAPDSKDHYWQKLQDLGLIKSVQPTPTESPPFTPVAIADEPLSQTIIEERR